MTHAHRMDLRDRRRALEYLRHWRNATRAGALHAAESAFLGFETIERARMAEQVSAMEHGEWSDDDDYRRERAALDRERAELLDEIVRLTRMWTTPRAS